MAKSFYTIVIIFVVVFLHYYPVRCVHFDSTWTNANAKWKVETPGCFLFSSMRVHSSVVKDERITSTTTHHHHHHHRIVVVVVLVIVNHKIYNTPFSISIVNVYTMKICSRLFQSNFAFFQFFFLSAADKLRYTACAYFTYIMLSTFSSLFR